jgi:hypothetical protein
MLLGVKVAEHVGTKGKEACIRQFLRLPIEDRILDAKLDEGVHPQPSNHFSLLIADVTV